MALVNVKFGNDIITRLQRTLLLLGIPMLVLAGFAFGQNQERAGAAPPPPIVAPPLRSQMLVNARWLVENLDRPELVILQIGKDDGKYKEGHIPGAQFVAWDELVVDRNGVPNEMPSLEDLTKLVRRLGITDQSRIVVYDDDSGLHAARAYVMLDYLGLGDRTSMLDGQYKKWAQDKRTVSAAVPKVEPSTYIPHPHPDVLIHLQQVRDLSWEKTQMKKSPVALVDARPPDQFSGAKAGEDIKRPGHIPGAVNVYSMDNYVSKDDPTFRPIDDLRSLYADAGLDKKDTTVAYCRSGVQASLTYFTLKYLGYDPRLYDGSFSEWSDDSDAPVAATAATPELKETGEKK